MKTVAIIQARLSSQRLPGKVLLDISDHPMLYHVVSRTKRAKTLDQVIVATSTDKPDEAVAAFCADEGIRCVRGDLNDVLSRYFHAAENAKADIIVRVTGDCP